MGCELRKPDQTINSTLCQQGNSDNYFAIR